MNDKMEAIETKIDNLSNTQTGEELIACIALHARYSVAEWKADKFIQEFSLSLGYSHHLDTALKILEYLYPRNRAFWKVQDNRYTEIVKSSAWLKYNCR